MSVSVYLSIAAFPHQCMDPDVTWANGRGCPLVVHIWADFQPVHGFHCYDNIAPRGFAISAHDNSGKCEMLVTACTRSMPGRCCCGVCDTSSLTSTTPVSVNMTVKASQRGRHGSQRTLVTYSKSTTYSGMTTSWLKMNHSYCLLAQSHLWLSLKFSVNRRQIAGGVSHLWHKNHI